MAETNPNAKTVHCKNVKPNKFRVFISLADSESAKLKLPQQAFWTMNQLSRIETRLELGVRSRADEKMFQQFSFVGVGEKPLRRLGFAMFFGPG